MARGGLLEAWVGKAVQVLVAGDREPWVGNLVGWEDRGIVLRYTEATPEADRAARNEPHVSEGHLILFPWPTVRYVGISEEDLGGE
jgi:hypothetical protein